MRKNLDPKSVCMEGGGVSGFNYKLEKLNTSTFFFLMNTYSLISIKTCYNCNWNINDNFKTSKLINI